MTHPSDVLFETADDDLSVPRILLCDHREGLNDWPRVDGQLSKARRIIPTEIVGICIINVLRVRRGRGLLVVVRGRQRMLRVRLGGILHVAVGLTLGICRHRPSTYRFWSGG